MTENEHPIRYRCAKCDGEGCAVCNFEGLEPLPAEEGGVPTCRDERRTLAKEVSNEEVRPLRDLYERSYQASRYAELHPADYGAMCSEEMHSDEFWDAVKVAIAKERRAAASANDLAEIWRGFATAAAHALAPLGDDFAFEDPDGLAGAISRLIAALRTAQARVEELERRVETLIEECNEGDFAHNLTIEECDSLRAALAVSQDRERELTNELFTMRRWAADASLYIAEKNSARAKTDVDRIYRRLLKLTDRQPRPSRATSRPSSLEGSSDATGAESGR